MSLERALAQLLCDASFRARVESGDLTGLDDDAREALATIDEPRVRAAAAAIVREVRARRHRGVGTLEEIFGEALAHFGEEGRANLFVRFVSSKAFAGHGRGRTSLEEAFARFLRDECDGCDAALIERLFLRALTRSLAVCGEPTFSVPSSVQRRARGWCAVAAGPTLFAAIDGRAMEGPIDDVLAAMVRSTTSEQALAAARDRGLSQDAARRLFDALEGMGLAPPMAGALSSSSDARL